jgi:hypothetical protein
LSDTVIEEQAAAGKATVSSSLRRGASEAFARRRLLVFAAFFGVELLILATGLTVPLAPAERQAIQQAAEAQLPSGGTSPLALFADIFANNIRWGLLEVIPLAGSLLFGVITFSTGEAIQVLGSSGALNLPGALVGLLLFAFPFTWVELSAYAFATMAGSLAFMAAFKRRLRKEMPTLLVEVVVVGALIASAALMETITIESPLGGVLLWVPTILALVVPRILARPLRSRGEVSP